MGARAWNLGSLVRIARPSRRDGRRSDAGDIGGEEVDAVAVEVASRTVVVLGGAGVGVPGQVGRPAAAHRHPVRS
jgi:hypothetical protein